MTYLDTHVVVWLYDKRLELLSIRARRLLEAEPLFISPMVILELEYLRETKRITPSSQQIIDYLGKKLGLSICDKAFPEVITKACKLFWTRDPFDRVIVGHASLDENQLLTKDDRIRTHYKYAVW